MAALAREGHPSISTPDKSRDPQPRTGTLQPHLFVFERLARPEFLAIRATYLWQRHGEGSEVVDNRETT